MIVVDTSVWIDFLNGRSAAHAIALREALGRDEIIIGYLMLCEVLQGLDGEREARTLKRYRRPGRSQFSYLAQTRHYHSQNHRSSDRYLVHREPSAAAAQR